MLYIHRSLEKIEVNVNDIEFEESIIEKCRSMSAEDLGLYIIRSLKQLNGKRNGNPNRPISTSSNTYREIMGQFAKQLDALRVDPTFHKKKIEALDSIWTSMMIQLDEVRGERKRSLFGRITEDRIIIDKNTVLIDYGDDGVHQTLDITCHRCKSEIDAGWLFVTNFGEIHLCDGCKVGIKPYPEIQPVRRGRSIYYWPRITSSSFESNRRKH